MKKHETLEKLQNMTQSELEKELNKASLDEQKFRIESESKKGMKISDLKKSRIYVAQIMTILNQKRGE